MAEILTTKGLIDESLLERKTGIVDNDNEFTTWEEYWLNGELVKRSAHVQVKSGVAAETGIGSF